MAAYMPRCAAQTAASGGAPPPVPDARASKRPDRRGTASCRSEVCRTRPCRTACSGPENKTLAFAVTVLRVPGDVTWDVGARVLFTQP